MIYQPRTRYPKGTYMRLKNRDLLRAMVIVQEDVDKARKTGRPVPPSKIPQRALAEMSGVTGGFINHLTSGRRKSCEPKTAERISGALQIPVDVLFDADETHGKRKKVSPKK
ncbi:hypothetical protein Pure05_01180 [Paenarthrobacter ureafaciens]|nr:hypothetical protein Pure01_11350 [Paenarthrobacter ureafaciens]GLU61867.1 hypothetical protein Pure02_01170 [Paenarthrobacter ureafaciens]GLU66141.1 hypothetical protein Pure03_01170 [Paenarthrobacter ureafaciens]GLU71535.1 hypothetical protein Pure04_12500 [Paenarthrobacter ureafaciens]GLU74678.1 hypothetical protein Pure05_01180 [Paenarthrobacter ureafaciens]